jgi:hypothetical protein
MTTVSLILRLILGVILLFYGMGKIVQNQFTPPAFAFGMPLGDLPGRTLAWAFFGHAGWFQVLMGLLEFVPAVMLFFRRTWRAGAVILVPVLTGVVLVNFAFDLWLATKVLSSALLLLNLAILALDWPRWRQIIPLVLEQGPDAQASANGPPPRPGSEPVRRLRTEFAVSMVVLAIGLAGTAAVVKIASERTAPLADFIGGVEGRGAGAFLLEFARVAGQEVPLPAEPVYLYFNSERNVILQSGGKLQRSKFNALRADSSFVIDNLSWGGVSGSLRGKYSVEENRGLRITGSHGDKAIEWRLRRRWPQPR